MTVETVEWHTIHPRFLGPDSIVIDVGASNGRFSRSMIDRFGCRCYAIDASPEACASIQPDKLLSTFNLAICSNSGPVKFHVNENPEASSIVDQTGSNIVKTFDVPGKHLEKFCTDLDLRVVDLLKLDIEGAEIGVIDSCSNDFLKNLQQITIEFHDFCGITHPSEVKRVIGRLKKIGFFPVRMSRNGHLDTLFINRNQCDISLWECLWIRYFIRNWVGLKRVLKRKISNRIH